MKLSEFIRSRRVAPYVFVLPGIVLLAALIVYPFSQALILSVRTENGWGLDNFVRALNHNLVKKALSNTLVFALVSVVVHYILGLGIALLINRNIYGKGFFRVAFLIPWMFPSVVPGIVWRWMLHGQFGIINRLLVSLGIMEKYTAWLVNGKTALWAVIVANSWRGYPIFVAVLLAGLQAIPQSLYEAAEIDGANRLKSFFYITLPSLKGVSYVILLVDTIWQFNSFTIVQTMTEGGPGHASEVFPTLIYRNAFLYNEYPYGAALGMILLALMLIPGTLYIWQTLKDEKR